MENNEVNYDDKIKSDKISPGEVMCYKIWLHAFNYKFEKYEFETRRPEWSLEEYDPGFKF